MDVVLMEAVALYPTTSATLHPTEKIAEIRSKNHAVKRKASSMLKKHWWWDIRTMKLGNAT
jgi:hypothetical protein